MKLTVTSSWTAAGVDFISVDIGATVSGLPAPSHRVIPYRAELCIQVVEQDIGRRAPLADAASLREQTDPGPERIAEWPGWAPLARTMAPPIESPPMSTIQ